MFDVIVVGAGPAGSFVAGEIARKGHRVALCERKGRVGEDVCCTGIIGREAFTRLPLREMAGKAIVREAASARLYSPSGRLLRVARDEPQAYIVNRAVFDAEMVRWAQAQGADLFLAAEARTVRCTDSLAGVEVMGKALPLEANVVVLACGFGSPLPQRLGLGAIGDFVVGAQCEVEADGIEEVEVHFHRKLAPGFFAWLVPTVPGRALAGLLVRRNPGESLRAFIGYLQAQGRSIKPSGRMSYGAIPLRPLPRTYSDRVLVVGEAAGQVKPLTGGGVYFGLIGAQAAADVLDEAIRTGDFSSAVLRKYEKGWRASIGRELQLGDLARRVQERFTDGQVEWLFGWLGSEGTLSSLLQEEGSSFDRHGKLLLSALKHEPFRAFWRSMMGVL